MGGRGQYFLRQISRVSEMASFRKNYFLWDLGEVSKNYGKMMEWKRGSNVVVTCFLLMYGSFSFGPRDQKFRRFILRE